jgi:hypothetical protein
VLWFVIDMLTGTDDLWFYWPVLGAGIIVAIIGIAMFGVSGLFEATGNGGRSTGISSDEALQRTRLAIGPTLPKIDRQAVPGRSPKPN